MNDTPSKSSITIKKYANRRLYNTATSSYVTLEDLSKMVKEGIEFNVYDAKTSEDITRSVLTQIIVEEEGKSGQQNLLPIGFLRQLIGFYGDSLQWMVPKYLEHSMQALTGNQDQIRSYFQTTIGNLFPFGSTLEEMSKQNLAMFERTMRLFTPFTLDGLTSAEGAKAALSAPQQQSPAPQASASVTNLKPRAETAKTQEPAAAAACKLSVAPQPAASAPSPTPMPSVQAATAPSTNAPSDDMQQKIANLQRQLADLAKSRAN